MPLKEKGHEKKIVIKEEEESNVIFDIFIFPTPFKEKNEIQKIRWKLKSQCLKIVILT